MIKLITGTMIALTIVSGTAFAQATTAKVDPAAAAVEAKFKAADKNSNGFLEAAELDTYKADLAKIDTNKDGKISLAEFVAASKAGVIK